MLIGLVFWISSACTGAPPARASGSPTRTGPIRDWSSCADRRSRASRPSIVRLVPVVEIAHVVEGAAALVLPGAGHHRQAGGGVHGGRTVARAGEAVAQAQEGALGAAVEPGEGHDLGLGQAGDRRGPGRRAGAQMALQLVRRVAVAGEIVPVGEALVEQHVHHAAGQRPVGARAQCQMHVGLLGRAGAVGVDHDQLRPALLPGAGDVAHQVDVGVDRVGAPDHDQIGVRPISVAGTPQRLPCPALKPVSESMTQIVLLKRE